MRLLCLQRAQWVSYWMSIFIHSFPHPHFFAGLLSCQCSDVSVGGRPCLQTEDITSQLLSDITTVSRNPAACPTNSWCLLLGHGGTSCQWQQELSHSGADTNPGDYVSVMCSKWNYKAGRSLIEERGPSLAAFRGSAVLQWYKAAESSLRQRRTRNENRLMSLTYSCIICTLPPVPSCLHVLVFTHSSDPLLNQGVEYEDFPLTTNGPHLFDCLFAWQIQAHLYFSRLLLYCLFTL